MTVSSPVVAGARLLRSLTIAVALCSLAACGTSLPVISGPFDPAPDPDVSTITEVGGVLVVPTSSAGSQDALAIAINPRVPWGDVAQSILDSATGDERGLYIKVTDPSGATNWLLVSLESRLTGPLYGELSAQLVRDEHVLILDQFNNAFRVRNQGQPLAVPDIAATLEKLFMQRAEFYFPDGEPPTRAELPIVIDARQSVEFGDLIGVLAACRSAGFENLQLVLPAAP